MPSLTSLLAALTVALALALGGTLVWWVPNLYESRAAARVARDAALEANASLVTAAKILKATADAESARAIARQKERDGLAAQTAALRQKLGDSLGACPWTDEQAKAIDEYLRGQ